MGGYSQTSRKLSLRPIIYPNGLEYPTRSGITPQGPGIFPPSREYPPRVGNIPTQPGISPKRTGNIPAGREYSPTGRESSRRPGIFPAGREYSRRPGIFPWGPGTKGTLERSRPPAVIYPAGRECSMDFSERYRGTGSRKGHETLGSWRHTDRHVTIVSCDPFRCRHDASVVGTRSGVATTRVSWGRAQVSPRN